MIRWACAACAVLSLLFAVNLPVSGLAAARRAPALPEPRPPAVEDVLQAGVLILISKASQRMYVFKDGEPWDSSPISSGKRGHSTPSGVFPILQKAVKHHSNLYSNAPMPYMQRLTWGGIAIHGGHLPGYPASHGCIRLPLAFARALFAETSKDATTVVVMDEPIGSFADAGTLAVNMAAPQSGIPGDAMKQPRLASSTEQAPPRAPRIAYLPLFGSPRRASGPSQTIQLAAAASAAEAEDHWAQLLSVYPQLAPFEKTVVPAVVGSRQYYRLRVSAPGAYAVCSSLRRSGQDCFNVG